jgi:glycosyltransferase involved in cell wall biosynthesis
MKLALISTDNRESFKRYKEPYPITPPPQEALLTGFEQIPELEVHFISCLQQEPIYSPIKLAANIYYHGLHVPKLGWMRTGYQGCVRSVRTLLQELKPDIVHGQGTERDCAISAVLSGFPNVITIHGNMRSVARILRAKPLTYYWLASRIEKFCLKRTNGAVAISTYTESNIKRYTKRIWLVPNAVHPSFFGVTRNARIPKRILCTANISVYKNQLGLIDALEPLARTIAFKLVFAGRGHEADPYFLQFKRRLKDCRWCEYLGSLDAQALRAEMAVAHMGILPSFEDNCPMVVLEAAAARLPFAASNVGGIPDLLVDRQSGMLFDPKDPGNIRECVSAMLTDSGLATRISSEAHHQATRRFTPSVIARQHVQLYADVLARPRT